MRLPRRAGSRADRAGGGEADRGARHRRLDRGQAQGGAAAHAAGPCGAAGRRRGARRRSSTITHSSAATRTPGNCANSARKHWHGCGGLPHFRPQLTGGVAAGWATAHSDIRLELDGRGCQTRRDRPPRCGGPVQVAAFGSRRCGGAVRRYAAWGRAPERRHGGGWRGSARNATATGRRLRGWTKPRSPRCSPPSRAASPRRPARST